VVGSGKRFHGNACVGIFAQKQIDHGVGNAIADFIGVAFGNGFASKEVMFWHGSVSGERFEMALLPSIVSLIPKSTVIASLP
jgi:hypothetical protein